MKKLFTCILAMATAITTFAQVNITRSAGWLETAYVEWTGQAAYTNYHVYVKPESGNYTQIDSMLVRNYGTCFRAEALGLKAGTYRMKVVPVQGNQELTAQAQETPSLSVSAHDRNGFAHAGRTAGVGAYNNDGTLKQNAIVLYVTNANAKTISADLYYNSATQTETVTGLQAIFDALNKGNEKRPVCVRIIGTLYASAMDAFSSVEEGLQIKGKKSYSELNLTIEGVGNDAAINGFGLLFRNCTSVEVRNLASLFCMDDCIGFDTDNSHCWVHHCDFFYGNAGGDADQAKGDGTVDMKANSKNITVSYCHFFDSGKSSLCGMKSEETTSMITYHHNWFDHSDSRHPRIRTMSVHVYNNYYDGNAKYGVGVTTGASAFVEGNYFRSCKHPILSSGQGTDAQGDGTFSGETGGIVKAYANQMSGSYQYRPYSTYGNNSDAYEVSRRADTIPASVITISGGTTYNNFDTKQTAVTAVTPDPAANVPAIVQGALGAGRCEKGDISWTFAAADDASYAINDNLKSQLTQYVPSLVAIAGGDSIYRADDGSNSNEPQTNGSWECYWDDATGKWSSPNYLITGNTTKKTQTITLLDGTTIDVSYGLKMESATSIKFTAPSDCTLKLVFQNDQTANIKVDGQKKTGSSNSLSLPLTAGQHEITKGDSRNLFYWTLTDLSTDIENLEAESIAPASKIYQNGQLRILRDGSIYDLLGRKMQ